MTNKVSCHYRFASYLIDVTIKNVNSAFYILYLDVKKKKDSRKTNNSLYSRNKVVLFVANLFK